MPNCGRQGGRQSKKLIEVGCFWASGTKFDEDAARKELEELGADEALIKEIIKGDRATMPEIMEDNLVSFDIFCACATQWRVSMAGFTGLDYTAVIAVINFKSVENKEQIFDDIRFLERGALQEMSKKRG